MFLFGSRDDYFLNSELVNCPGNYNFEFLGFYFRCTTYSNRDVLGVNYERSFVYYCHTIVCTVHTNNMSIYLLYMYPVNMMMIMENLANKSHYEYNTKFSV